MKNLQMAVVVIVLTITGNLQAQYGRKSAADIIRGRRITGWRYTADELRAAGGIYVDEAGVEDGPFITGRQPSDMPRMLARIVTRLKAAP